RRAELVLRAGLLGHVGERLAQVAVGLQMTVGPFAGVDGDDVGGGGDRNRADLLQPVLGQACQLPVLLRSPRVDGHPLAGEVVGDLGGEFPVHRSGLVEQLEQPREDVVVAHSRHSPNSTGNVSSSSCLNAVTTTTSPARFIRRSAINSWIDDTSSPSTATMTSPRRPPADS